MVVKLTLIVAPWRVYPKLTIGASDKRVAEANFPPATKRAVDRTDFMTGYVHGRRRREGVTGRWETRRGTKRKSMTSLGNSLS